MPHYDYVCEKCGHEFEVFQSMNDKHLTKCPQKGCKGKVRRKIGTGAGLVFKGSGFYITDYRSESYKTAAKQDSAAASSAASPASSSESSAAASPAPGSGGSGGGEKSAPAPKTETKAPAAKKSKPAT
ncbi:MAG: zinc ribbon domain-containing protein [Verrucomicrobiaceae bacterium]|nr:MAG: zinc ribbon domain-containing protein [Verrucomicrobiaceae bacterium]